MKKKMILDSQFYSLQSSLLSRMKYMDTKLSIKPKLNS